MRLQKRYLIWLVLTASALRSQEEDLNKLTPALAGLIPRQTTKSLVPNSLLAELALQAGVFLKGQRVAVRVLVSKPGNIAAVRQQITAQAGEVTAENGLEVYCWVPVAALQRIAAIVGVRGLYEQSEIEPLEQSTPSDVFLQDAIRSIGVTSPPHLGRGIKVGIVDFDFSQYDHLVSQQKLPIPAAVSNFGGLGADAGTSSSSFSLSHGTQTAMIIHAMAPGAAIYLAKIDSSEGSFLAAMDWMADHGVRVVNFSGGTPKGVGNGEDSLSTKVDELARTRGLLTVVAAGNSALRHLRIAAAADRDGDGWVDIPSQEAPFIRVQSESGQMKLLLRWEAGSTPSLDPVLFPCRPSSTGCRPITIAAPVPSGATVPYRYIYFAGSAQRAYYLGIRVRAGTKPFLLHVFAQSSDMTLQPNDPAGSIYNPATATSAIAVGAVNMQSGELEPFSSQGPRDDHRVKPELSGPSGVIIPPFGAAAGTSIAAPFVTGAAALLLEESPTLTGIHLRESLLSKVAAKGQGSPNNQYGRGILALAPPPRRSACSEPSVQIPESWGACLATRTLDRWRLTQRVLAGMTILFQTDQSLYHDGDHLTLNSQTTAGVAYLLLYRNAEGNYRKLSPEPSGWLTPGKRVVLSATLRPPFGDEEFVLLYSSFPKDLRDAEQAEGPPQGVGLAFARYRLLR